MASSEKTSICLRSVINHILFELHVLKCWACGKSVEDATVGSKTPVWFEDATVVRRPNSGSKTLQWVRRHYIGFEDTTLGSKTLVWFEAATVVRRRYCSSKTLLWFEDATVGSKTLQWVEGTTVGSKTLVWFEAATVVRSR